MTLKNYPSLCCKSCAQTHHGIFNTTDPIDYSMWICDVCNEWKSVADPTHFSYPKFTLNRDLNKIYTQLMRAMFNCILAKDYTLALDINYEIDEIIHEIYEKGLNDGTTTTYIQRKPRRAFREGNEISQRAI